VYVTLPWLNNTHKGLGKEMVFVHVYDPDTMTSIFTEKSRAQEPGCEFVYLLMCFTFVHSSIENIEKKMIHPLANLNKNQGETGRL